MATSVSIGPIRGRLAPTPSGYLHLGNAVNFVLTWLLVRRAGGTLHLRIDDLDRARLRPAYLDSIFQTIRWLGLDYDTGPRDPAEFEKRYSQLRHVGEYQALLDELRQQAGLLYACTCSRTTNLPPSSLAATESGCHGCRATFSTAGAAWRVRVPTTPILVSDAWRGPVPVDLAATMGDFVVRKKDGLPAYQLASLADDLRLGTTCIVRGDDLLPSTAAQLFLAAQLLTTAGFAQTEFVHHALILSAGGQKLSKSQQQPPDRGIMGAVSSPRLVYAAVAQLLKLPEAAAESLSALQRAL
ncbi:glutamyl-tRNA synthetase class Ic [Hymenobacter roseosalivarius DSM 11622]|uniref:Glutamyl-tRNA synthetase class Ic n=1 Tax=Hymenobacter roseosalivarius DSM 11622 TaxID=645990 RepID=A0A1W1V3R1_9BACT|nr:glutamate--tRNA ligase family protein [Hymenobacter roseosalivarius]SMB88009.1 glutamyl-tRNA synthetase class Ic [Hymenobacter roseosalivarius DSM 11622]